MVQDRRCFIESLVDGVCPHDPGALFRVEHMVQRRGRFRLKYGALRPNAIKAVGGGRNLPDR